MRTLRNTSFCILRMLYCTVDQFRILHYGIQVIRVFIRQGIFISYVFHSKEGWKLALDQKCSIYVLFVCLKFVKYELNGFWACLVVNLIRTLIEKICVSPVIYFTVTKTQLICSHTWLTFNLQNETVDIESLER